MKTYDELLKENLSLNKKLEILQIENQNLKRRLFPTLNTHISERVQSKVNIKSNPTEKIELFKSLFRGREDVFAKRWVSLKTGKAGYQPVCSNEWDRLLCNKKKYDCKNCPNRKLTPISDDVIFKHLEGKDELARDVIGVYPMLIDEATYFLAVDFDKSNYKEDVSAFKLACEENDVPCYIEISRSGNGAHVWIFFEDKLPSHLARKLGSGLLTYAMNLRSELKFSSYDRLFPNQDLMPSGGFGNLISLPLQGKARKKGFSVFVDDDFIPHKDQWAYLSNVKKLSLEEVENKAKLLCKNSDLGQLLKENNDNPWEALTIDNDFNSNDYPENGVNIIKSNMIYIEKAALSNMLLNKLKRLASFKNPDFYKSQAMRLPTYNKPRIISLVEVTDKYIALPRGVEESLVKFLGESNIKYNIDDKSNKGKNVKVRFNGNLRENQIPATERILNYDIGVLSATTAFGKTVVAAKVIAERGVNTLVLVHTQSLLGQWKKSLSEFLEINNELTPLPIKRGRKKERHIIGQLGGGKNSLNGIVDVAIMQSLINEDDVKELVRDYGQIIVDECHHVSAINFERILRFANAKYILGLTATPIRQDGQHPIIFLQCGEIRYKVNTKLEAINRGFKHYVIPRFTSLKKYSITDESKIATIYNDIMLNDARNNLIINDVKKAYHDNRNIIVLTERLEHIEKLSELLRGICENIIALCGKMSAKERRTAENQISRLKKSDKFILIATGKYVGEGFDFPRLDTLF